MENLVVSANKKVTIEKFTSQIKLIAQTGVKKVLNASAESFVTNCECTGGFVSLSGKIKVDVIYLSYENTIEKTFAEADFIEKQKLGIELSDNFANDILTVTDINFSSNEIICSITHNTEIMGIYKYEIANFASEESIVANISTLESLKFVCASEDNFSIAEEIETNLRDIQVLKTNAKAVVDEVVSSVDKVVVEGRIFIEMIYQENEKISSVFRQIEFKQEIKAENAEPNMKTIAFIQIKNAVVSFEENGDKYVLTHNIDMFSKCYVYENYNYEIATDLFMLNNEISTTYDFIESKNYHETIEQSESVLSQTDITDIVDFDDIIGVFEPNIYIEKIYNHDGKSEISAKVTAYALYSSQDDIKRLEISEDVKFEILTDKEQFVDSVCSNCQIVSSKVKAGKEIEVVFKINCHVNLASITSSKYVKSYEINSQKLSNDAGIKVYITRQNQTVFDVAKALNVRPELILKQNEVEDVFESGQRIYVYSPINLA